MNFLSHLRVERFIEEHTDNVSDFIIDDDKDGVIIKAGSSYSGDDYIEIKGFNGEEIPFKISNESNVKGIQFSNCQLCSLYGLPKELKWINLKSVALETFRGIPNVLNILRMEKCYIPENLEGIELVRWKPTLASYSAIKIKPMLYINETNIKSLGRFHSSESFYEIRIIRNDKLSGELEINVNAERYTIEENCNITSVKLGGSPKAIDINRNEKLNSFEIESLNNVAYASFERNEFTTIGSFKELFNFNSLLKERDIHLKGNPFTDEDFEKLKEIRRKIDRNTALKLNLFIDSDLNHKHITAERMLKYSAFRDMLMSEIQ